MGAMLGSSRPSDTAYQGGRVPWGISARRVAVRAPLAARPRAGYGFQIETAHRHALSLLLGSLFLAKLGVVLWGLSRGFDLGDGGFFLLCLNHPEQAPPLFEFYRLLSWLDSPPHFDVVGARALRVASELIATLVLALGVRSWVRARLPELLEPAGPPLWLFGLLGALLGVGAREFGYNDATNLVTFAATAALLCALALPAGSGGRARFALSGWGALFGAALGFQLFIKFPPALGLGAAGLAIAGVALRGGARERGIFLATAVLAALLVVGLFVVAGGGPAALADKLALAGEVNRLTGYGIGEILRVYLHHDIGSHANLLGLTLAFGLAWLAARKLFEGLPSTEAQDRSLRLALLVGSVVLVAGASSYHAQNVHPTLVFLFCSLVFLSVLGLALGLGSTAGARRWEVLPVLLLLLGLPFLDTVGTNVALTLRLPTHITPAFFALAVLTARLRSHGLVRYATATTLLMAAATSLLFFHHHWLRPYGLPSPLHRQVEAVEGLPGVRVDAATRVFLESLRTRMQEAGYVAGDPVVALDFMPGLVHYLDARSPGFPFYGFDSVALNCWAINRESSEQAPFLILGQSMLLEQRRCIERFDFPGDFERVATLRNPYENAVRYFFGGPSLEFVEVFGPTREATP